MMALKIMLQKNQITKAFHIQKIGARMTMNELIITMMVKIVKIKKFFQILRFCKKDWKLFTCKHNISQMTT